MNLTTTGGIAVFPPHMERSVPLADAPTKGKGNRAMRKTALSVVAVLAVSAPLAAMEEVDVNDDGVATLEEIQAVYPDFTPADFARLDVNADGMLDEDEYAQGVEDGLIPDGG